MSTTRYDSSRENININGSFNFKSSKVNAYNANIKTVTTSSGVHNANFDFPDYEAAFHDLVGTGDNLPYADVSTLANNTSGGISFSQSNDYSSQSSPTVETASGIQNYDESTFNDEMIVNGIDNILSTATVVGANVVKGVAATLENVTDTILSTLGAAIVYGGSRVGDAINNTDDAGKNLTSWLDMVATNDTEKIYNDFFNEENIGAFLDDNSSIKSDSELATGISTVSKALTEAGSVLIANIYLGAGVGGVVAGTFAYAPSFAKTFSEQIVDENGNIKESLSSDELVKLYFRAGLKGLSTGALVYAGGALTADASTLAGKIGVGGANGLFVWLDNVLIDSLYYQDIGKAFEANGGINNLLLYTITGSFAGLASGVISIFSGNTSGVFDTETGQTFSLEDLESFDSIIDEFTSVVVAASNDPAAATMSVIDFEAAFIAKVPSLIVDFFKRLFRKVLSS